MKNIAILITLLFFGISLSAMQSHKRADYPMAPVAPPLYTAHNPMKLVAPPSNTQIVNSSFVALGKGEINAALKGFEYVLSDSNSTRAELNYANIGYRQAVNNVK